MRRFFQLLMRQPALVAGFILLLALPFVREVLEPRFRSNFDFYFEPDDRDLREYQNYIKTFDVLEGIVVVLEFEAESLFTNESLQKIRRIAQGLRTVEHIAKVQSLADYKTTRLVGDELQVSTFYPDQEVLSPAEVEAAKSRILADQWIPDKLIGKNGRFSMLLLEMDKLESAAEKGVVIKQIYTKLEEHLKNTKIKHYVVGASLAEANIEELLKEDNFNFMMVVPVTIAVLVLLLVRNIPASIILVINVFLTAGWLIGIMYHSGEALNPVTVLIMPTLIATGIAEGIHIINHLLELLKKRQSGLRKTMVQAMNDMWLPCLLTSMTSLVSYLSFLSSDIYPIKMMGIFMSIGLVLAWLLTLVMIPSMMVALSPIFGFHKQPKAKEGQNPPKPGEQVAAVKDEVDDDHHPPDFFEKMCRFILGRPYAFSIGAILVAGSLIAGMARLRIDTNLEAFLPEENRFRQDLEYVEKNLGSQVRYEVIITATNDQKNFAQPEMLGKLGELQTALAEHFRPAQQIGSHWSIHDFVKELSKNIGNGALPKDADGVVELLDFGDPKLVNELVSKDYRKAKVTFLGRFKMASEKRELLDQVQILSKKIFADEVKTYTTSIPVLYFLIGERIFDTQVSSFATAFIPIFIMMTIIGRGLHMGIISMIPNIVPIFALFGIMGWLNIPLDTATAMIASIVLGIAIDDTIHFFHWYGKMVKKGYGRVDAIAKTFSHCGRASLFTSTIVAFGFLMLVTSQIVPLRYFGMLTAVAMAIGVACEVLLLPLALYFIDRRTPMHSLKPSLKVVEAAAARQKAKKVKAKRGQAS